MGEGGSVNPNFTYSVEKGGGGVISDGPLWCVLLFIIVVYIL